MTLSAFHDDPRSTFYQITQGLVFSLSDLFFSLPLDIIYVRCSTWKGKITFRMSKCV